jgi:hypothetical protein
MSTLSLTRSCRRVLLKTVELSHFVLAGALSRSSSYRLANDPAQWFLAFDVLVADGDLLVGEGSPAGSGSLWSMAWMNSSLRARCRCRERMKE